MVSSVFVMLNFDVCGSGNKPRIARGKFSCPIEMLKTYDGGLVLIFVYVWTYHTCRRFYRWGLIATAATIRTQLTLRWLDETGKHDKRVYLGTTAV